jgi:hypothetical protein
MPLTANDRIILIRVKVERAKKHLRDLAAELLVRDHAVVVESQIDSEGAQSAAHWGLGIADRVYNIPRLPIDVLPIAGDVIHNLRAALDHLAGHLVIVGSGKEPSRRIEFPIAKDEATYEAEKARKVEGMRPEAIEAIDRLKPYKGGNDALWRIHELDNIDKHRSLFTVAHDYLFWADWFDGDYWLKTDSPNFSGVDAQVEQNVQLEIEEAASQPSIASSNALLPTLHQLVDFVESLIMEFRPYLG